MRLHLEGLSIFVATEKLSDLELLKGICREFRYKIVLFFLRGGSWLPKKFLVVKKPRDRWLFVASNLLLPQLLLFHRFCLIQSWKIQNLLLLV